MLRLDSVSGDHPPHERGSVTHRHRVIIVIVIVLVIAIIIIIIVIIIVMLALLDILAAGDRVCSSL